MIWKTPTLESCNVVAGQRVAIKKKKKKKSGDFSSPKERKKKTNLLTLKDKRAQMTSCPKIQCDLLLLFSRDFSKL